MGTSSARADAAAEMRRNGMPLATGSPSQRDSHSREMCCPALMARNFDTVRDIVQRGVDTGLESTEARLT